MATWGKERDRRGFGFALIDYSGANAAGIAEVTLNRSTGTIRVHDFWCPLDCGVAVQPDNVVVQTESSIIYGLDMSLSERTASRMVLPTVELLRCSGATDERGADDAYLQPSGWSEVKGRSSDSACDCHAVAQRRAPVSHAVHARPRPEGARIEKPILREKT